MDYNRGGKFKFIRLAISVAVTTLVEVFVGAATNGVMHNVDGGRLAKMSAKAGGFLVGMWLGGQVSDYVCDNIDNTLSDIDEIKEQLEEGD